MSKQIKICLTQHEIIFIFKLEGQAEGLLFSRKGASWSGSMVRMPPGHLNLEVFQACPTRRKPRADPEPTEEIINLI